MQSQKEIVDALAQISDENMLGMSAQDLIRSGYKALKGLRFDGLALRVTKHIEIGKHSSAPALIAMGQGAERPRQVPLPNNACFVVTRIGQGESWVSPAFPPPSGKIPMPPGKQAAPPPPMNSSMRITGVEWRDLRALGVLPWEPGRYALRIISWDWLSNTVLITLADQNAVPKAPGVVTASGPPGTPDALPSFVRGPNSPALEGIGVALSMPPAPVKEGAPLVARGSLRLKADAEWPKTADGATVIPVQLVLARLGIVMPIVIDLKLLLSGVRNPKAGDEVEAYFSVDLDKINASPLPIAEYQAYLIAGEYVSLGVPFRKIP